MSYDYNDENLVRQRQWLDEDEYNRNQRAKEEASIDTYIPPLNKGGTDIVQRLFSHLEWTK